jgi:two-component system, LytTR family, response regulator
MANNIHIKAVVVDDSPQARELLRLMLQEFAPDVEIVAEAENGNLGITAIKTYAPDVAFLDIDMPEKSGIELAEELVKENINCRIVFTTAFNQYAINAFRLSAIDYLLKPINEQQLIESVEKIRQQLQLKTAQVQLKALSQNLKPNQKQVICVPNQNGYDYINISDIEYLEADGSYVHLFLTDKKQKTVSKNLKYFEQTLKPFSSFVRVHRSFIINLDLMASFSKSGRGTIIMQNGKEVDLARDRRSDFLNILGKIGK